MQPSDRDPLDRVGRELLAGARPPAPPAELRDRALAAARSAWYQEADPPPASQPSPLDRWVGALFRSRLLWTAWATAILLALLLGPPQAGSDEPTAPATYAAQQELNDPFALGGGHRPDPAGPRLRDVLEEPRTQAFADITGRHPS